MKMLVVAYLFLLVVNITVWVLTAWKCWRIGGSNDTRFFGRALAGHFLSLGACFSLSLLGALLSPQRPPPEIIAMTLTFSGMALLSCASWAFLLYMTGRGK